MRIIFFLISLLFTNYMHAQLSLDRQFVGSSGANTHAGSLQVSNSVGEAVIQTGIQGSLILTQGMQQADEEVSTGIEPAFNELKYSFFPNPVKDVLQVHFTSQESIHLHLVIFDLHGKKVWETPENLMINGQLKTQYNLGHLASGVYTLQMLSDMGSQLRSVKLHKL